MKNAMIWGASGGIGRAITEELKEAGWMTIAVLRDVGEMEGLVDFAFEADLNDPVAIDHAVYATSQEVEQIDLWIYAAGDILSAKVEQMAPADWQRILTANLSGAYSAIHSSMPLLSEDAHLIFLGAVSERLRLPGLSAYAAAKAGLEAFAETLAKEERKKRITVVRPGAVATDLWKKVPMRLPVNAASPEKLAKKILEANQSGHRGKLDLV